MIFKSSAILRNNYSTISKLAKESEEPIFIIENGICDGVFMSIEKFEKREQLLDLSVSILEAEISRLNGKPTMSVSKARKMLTKRKC